jgi:predicted esterase
MDQSNVTHSEHLCVLIHGYGSFHSAQFSDTDRARRLWGTPVHFANVVKTLRERYSKERLHILVSERNSGYFTYDGIETCGERVCQEIEKEIEKLARDGRVLKKLSIVGYSLGGLVARYVIGLLYSKRIFEKIEPAVSISVLS